MKKWLLFLALMVSFSCVQESRVKTGIHENGVIMRDGTDYYIITKEGEGVRVTQISAEEYAKLRGEK